MATTTSNFSWPIPQSTDLVKDGATAIASLGSGIDTSMAELKGGTTGQILSKASGTDMDFTWINNDQGDITGVTAGTGLTGGGTSGSVTLDFDVANYGGGQYAAGKNKIINGDFGIWQRGTSFTNPTVNQYLADRWYFGGGSNFTGTISAQTFTPGTAPVAGYEETYYWRFNGSATTPNLSTRLEDVRLFAGQTVTFSFWAKANASFATGLINLYQYFGSGGSAGENNSVSGVTLTTSWARYSFTINLPSISGKTIGTGSYLQPLINFSTMSSNTVDIWGVQLEAGSTATPFQTATGTKQGELAACQRYYWRISGSANNGIMNAYYASATQAEGLLQFPVTMRTAPSCSSNSGTNYFATFRAGGAIDTFNAFSGFAFSNTNNVLPYFNALTGKTAGQSFSFVLNNSSAWIEASAEL